VLGPDPCDQGPNQSLHSLDQAVRGMSVQENDKQHARRQVRKNLKPRQFVDWQTLAEPVLVSRFDMTQQVYNQTGLKGRMLENAVAPIWDGGSCFPRGLYWVENEKLTKAEALVRWLRCGYNSRQVTERFNNCNAVQPPEERQVSEQWRQEAIERELASRSSATGRVSRTPSPPPYCHER
jgi:hypothetical protein